MKTADLYFLFSDVPPGTAVLQISPQGVAYVEENNSLMLSCRATDIAFHLFRWRTAGDGHSYDIYKSNGACSAFSPIDSSLYRFYCIGNMSIWIIRHVTRQQHDDEWYCGIDDVQASESRRTRIFVTGNNFVITKQMELNFNQGYLQ